MPERITEFSRGSYTFDVVDSGPLDSDTAPVVLLHGFPERATAWDGVTAILNEQGLRTVAPDQRGYSPRARPNGLREYRIEELAGDVIALADALGAQTIHLVGHDWGAGVAWTVAALYPERLASLTALAVPHPGAFIRAMPRGQLLRSWYMGLFQIPRLPEWLLTKGVNRGNAADKFGPDGFTEQLRTEIIEYGALTGGLNWYRGVRYAKPSLRNIKVTVPTTYIWSDGDTFLGRAGARGCADMVTGPYDFIVINGVDHWLPQRCPTEIAAAVSARIAAS